MQKTIPNVHIDFQHHFSEDGLIAFTLMLSAVASSCGEIFFSKFNRRKIKFSIFGKRYTIEWLKTLHISPIKFCFDLDFDDVGFSFLFKLRARSNLKQKNCHSR